MPSYIQNYYSQLRTWENSITYDHLWKINIGFPEQMLRNAEKLLTTYNGYYDSVAQTKINASLDLMRSPTRSGSDNGLFYARTVTLPSESAMIQHGANNGYLTPLISSGRAEPSTVTVAFLETNVSLENVIRAWIKVVGDYGLIQRNDLNVHGSMEVYLLGPADFQIPTPRKRRALARPMAVRKTLNFEHLVPVSCQPTTYTQKSLGTSVEFTVTFKYERYFIT